MEAVIELLELADVLLRWQMTELLNNGYNSEKAAELVRAISDVDSALVNLRGGAA